MVLTDEKDAHEDWVSFGFPEVMSINGTLRTAQHIVKQFAGTGPAATVLELVPAVMSPSAMQVNAVTRLGFDTTPAIKYDARIAARPPCMRVGCFVHELFHVLVWEQITGVDPDDLTDEEHELLVLAGEHLCLFPGVADLTFDAMTGAWSLRLRAMDPPSNAVAHAMAVKARVEVLGDEHTRPMTPGQANRVFHNMLRQFLKDRGYTDGT